LEKKKSGGGGEIGRKEWEGIWVAGWGEEEKAYLFFWFFNF
jgi:hypothetical protein